MNKSEQDRMGVIAGVVIPQLLIFSAVKRHREPQSDATATRHDPNIESPYYPSIWDYVLVHAEIRKKLLVDKFYKYELSISYDREMQISADLENSVCAAYEQTHIWEHTREWQRANSKAKRSFRRRLLTVREEGEPALISVKFSLLLRLSEVKYHWSKRGKGDKTVNLLCFTRSN